MDMLKELGLRNAHGTRVPIDDTTNDVVETDVMLPVSATSSDVSVRKFQSLVRSFLWVSRFTRPDISFAVHRATRRTHCPTEVGWKLAKKIARYLQETKYLRLRMRGHDDTDAPINLVGYSEADFAADKSDRKSVTGDLLKWWVCQSCGLLVNIAEFHSLLWKLIILRHRLSLQR